MSQGSIPPLSVKPFEPGSRIHFVGIAGSGMNGIAQILKARGFIVSGSDEKESQTLKDLASRGIQTYVGHRAEQIGDARYLVVSSAIADGNAEVEAARARGIEIVRRAGALARLLLGRVSIAVAGTHGKTTTSGMLAHVLDLIDRDPSFVIGSTIASLGVSARQGRGEEFVVEADESDGSFMEYRPSVAIITNVELDHVDHFPSLSEVMETFAQFVETIQDTVVICADDRNASTLPIPSRLRRITYGFHPDADLRITASDGEAFEVCWQGAKIGPLRLLIPGRHNLRNAAAVIATAISLGLEPSTILDALSQFQGTARRFELKGMAAGVTVVDDYGHHPTEIAATIEAARSYMTAGKGGRLAVIFQPHRFSRTSAFLDEFASELRKADLSLLLDIYGAGEKEIEGVSSEAIAAKIGGPTQRLGREEAVSEIVAWVREGDLVLTLGAGDVTELGPLILSSLRARSEVGSSESGNLG